MAENNKLTTLRICSLAVCAFLLVHNFDIRFRKISVGENSRVCYKKKEEDKKIKTTTRNYSDTVLYISLISRVTPATSQLMEFLSTDGQI